MSIESREAHLERLINQLEKMYGNHLTREQVKVVFHYSSIAAVWAAVRQKKLTIYFDESTKVFKAADIAKYIVNQFEGGGLYEIDKE